MASVVLGTVGRAVGAQFGPAGSIIGSVLGSAVGQGLDATRGSKRHYEGARLEELAIQSSLYGRSIPIVFGSMRLAGNVIWARPLKELQTTSTTRAGGKGGGGSSRASSTTVSYSYYATLAIAICEGEITRINRIWADAKLLNLSQGTYRIYKGSETQLPDPLIESFEGVGKTPAYRGMAYVVVEDFPIGEFGNRIPNFTFEVVRTTPQRDNGELPVESMVTSVMLIPGSGEFVYDTQSQFKVTGQTVGGNFVQQGYTVPINQHSAEGVANVNLALDQMQQTFPNLEWVGVVVNWFGSSMDIASCTITPRVEYKDTVATTPDTWGVAGLTRASASLVGKDGTVVRYGGTPDDQSIVRLCANLRARGLKIFFYPMLLMDVAGKPWRGRLTGSAGQVANFFTKSWGYNHFIQHYATMLAGKIDAFAIGTELRDLSGISSSTGVFPAVAQLVTLAGAVKATLGSSVKVTYAADWSEYHHTDGGWYHLDPLWSASSIDMVGIDAYFPLSNDMQTSYDVDAIRAGWTSGEGWDFYYTDETRTTTAPLAAPYAWKNIDWWWNNPHVNPNGATTSWVPGSKPIWLTEYGFASVDGCANEPNKFVDPTSSESGYPRFSRGRVDFMAQRVAIAATEAEWAGSSMITNKFLWTWDARPYPYWPDLRSVWADGANWATGHWVQGKLGASHVAAVVEDVARRVGIAAGQIDTSALQMMLDGFVIHERTSARAVISQLMQGYFFTVVERKDGLKAVQYDRGEQLEISEQDCIPMDVAGRSVASVLERSEDITLPALVEVHYLNRMKRYETHVQSACRATQESREQQALRLGVVMSESHARTVAEMHLTRSWAERCRVTLQLPLKYARVEPGDVLLLQGQRLRVEQVQLGKPGMLRIRAVRSYAQAWDGYIAPPEGASEELLLPPSATRCELLDIPALPGDAPTEARLRVAACGISSGWQGANILRLSDFGDTVVADVASPSVMGTVIGILGNGTPQRIDHQHMLEVSLLGDATLSSVTVDAMLGGANVALVGNEIIQFANAESLGEGIYRLSTLLRGRLGTEQHCQGHAAMERFVLLDASVTSVAVAPTEGGNHWNIRAVSVGSPLDIGTEFSTTLSVQSLKPYAPVHLKARKTGGDIMIGWVRRARIDGAMRAGVDIPLMEEREEYEVRVMSGSTLKRSWRAHSPSQIYTLAEQMADFGSVPSSLSLQIAQISALVGLGDLAIKTVPVE